MFAMVALIWGSLSFAQTYPCQATYRELDITRQEVSSQDEFYFCFGYHHGRDRAWLMDYFRRSAEGTNAEVLGHEHLKADLMMRLLDLKSHAEKIWAAYPENEKKKLEAYSRGVNEGFKTGKGAREFIDLGMSPEEWKPVHSLEILLLQSFDQTRRTFVTDWEQEKLKAQWKDRAAILMDNDNVPWENTILKTGEYKPMRTVKVSPPINPTSVPNLWSRFPAVFGEESGSNNWVISAKKSKTGKAILANDPHLDLKTPLFWYWIQLKSPGEEVIGASLPGVPLVASGTNGKVAWGLTNAYINTADAVFVKDIPTSEIETVRPLVWVKFWFLKLPFFFKSFERAKTGHPVLPLEIDHDERMFLRWTGFSLKPEDITPMFNLPSVSDVASMNERLKTVGLPSWNFVFADTKGEIGYRVIGNVYRSVGATPYGMQSLSYDELKRHDLFTPDERPHVLNPSRGYIYSANNRHWPVDSELNGGRGYVMSFRGNRIDELIQGPQDVKSSQAIQCDHQAVDAKYFVPKLRTHLKMPELENWDFMTTENQNAPSIYRRFMDLLMEKWNVNEYGLWRLLDTVNDKMMSEMHFFYQDVVKSMNQPWGDFHKLSFAHLSKNDDWKFSPEISLGGDKHTVDPGSSNWNEKRKVYEHYSGASMRMVIEMEKTPRIHLVLPGFNRDYTSKSDKNPWNDWKNCSYTTFTM